MWESAYVTRPKSRMRAGAAPPFDQPERSYEAEDGPALIMVKK
jgi:hypothetical protein